MKLGNPTREQKAQSGSAVPSGEGIPCLSREDRISNLRWYPGARVRDSNLDSIIGICFDGNVDFPTGRCKFDLVVEQNGERAMKPLRVSLYEHRLWRHMEA